MKIMKMDRGILMKTFITWDEMENLVDELCDKIPMVCMKVFMQYQEEV